eukprot:SAG11_NODE_15286_length_583_cov_0.803719_2_plen_146_part_01
MAVFAVVLGMSHNCANFVCSHSLLNVAATSHFGGCAIVDTLTPALAGLVADSSQPSHTRFIPECVLIRDHCRSVHGEDHAHQLLGLMHGQTPCVNEARAVLQSLDRPAVFAALLELRNEMGMDRDGSYHFPLIDQDYFANEAPQRL